MFYLFSIKWIDYDYKINNIVASTDNTTYSAYITLIDVHYIVIIVTS